MWSYKSHWLSVFARWAALISPAYPPGSALHHVGSTADPGLAAKAIVTVGDLSVVDLALLKAHGFEHVPGAADHFPAIMNLPAIELHEPFRSALCAALS